MEYKQLFKSVKSYNDPKGRVVHIAQDGNSFYVYKPNTGFKSRLFTSADDPKLLKTLQHQIDCSQNTAFYQPGEAPTEEEVAGAVLSGHPVVKRSASKKTAKTTTKSVPVKKVGKQTKSK